MPHLASGHNSAIDVLSLGFSHRHHGLPSARVVSVESFAAVRILKFAIDEQLRNINFVRVDPFQNPNVFVEGNCNEGNKILPMQSLALSITGLAETWQKNLVNSPLP